eukprot:2243586-Amphidinium_carterae.1
MLRGGGFAGVSLAATKEEAEQTLRRAKTAGKPHVLISCKNSDLEGAEEHATVRIDGTRSSKGGGWRFPSELETFSDHTAPPTVVGSTHTWQPSNTSTMANAAQLQVGQTLPKHRLTSVLVSP